MRLWPRRRPPRELAGGHATIVAVGRSNDQPAQDAVIVRVRLRVERDGAEPYGCTVRWLVPTGSLGGLREGRRVPVRVDVAEREHVEPAWGGASWSAI